MPKDPWTYRKRRKSKKKKKIEEVYQVNSFSEQEEMSVEALESSNDLLSPEIPSKRVKIAETLQSLVVPAKRIITEEALQSKEIPTKRVKIEKEINNGSGFLHSTALLPALLPEENENNNAAMIGFTTSDVSTYKVKEEPTCNTSNFVKSPVKHLDDSSDKGTHLSVIKSPIDIKEEPHSVSSESSTVSASLSNHDDTEEIIVIQPPAIEKHYVIIDISDDDEDNCRKNVSGGKEIPISPAKKCQNVIPLVKNNVPCTKSHNIISPSIGDISTLTKTTLDTNMPQKLESMSPSSCEVRIKTEPNLSKSSVSNITKSSQSISSQLAVENSLPQEASCQLEIAKKVQDSLPIAGTHSKNLHGWASLKMPIESSSHSSSINKSVIHSSASAQNNFNIQNVKKEPLETFPTPLLKYLDMNMKLISSEISQMCIHLKSLKTKISIEKTCRSELGQIDRTYSPNLQSDSIKQENAPIATAEKKDSHNLYCNSSPVSMSNKMNNASKLTAEKESSLTLRFNSASPISNSIRETFYAPNATAKEENSNILCVNLASPVSYSSQKTYDALNAPTEKENSNNLCLNLVSSVFNNIEKTLNVLQHNSKDSLSAISDSSLKNIDFKNLKKIANLDTLSSKTKDSDFQYKDLSSNLIEDDYTDVPMDIECSPVKDSLARTYTSNTEIQNTLASPANQETNANVSTDTLYKIIENIRVLDATKMCDRTSNFSNPTSQKGSPSKCDRPNIDVFNDNQNTTRLLTESSPHATNKPLDKLDGAASQSVTRTRPFETPPQQPKRTKLSIEEYRKNQSPRDPRLKSQLLDSFAREKILSPFTRILSSSSPETPSPKRSGTDNLISPTIQSNTSRSFVASTSIQSLQATLAANPVSVDSQLYPQTVSSVFSYDPRLLQPPLTSQEISLNPFQSLSNVFTPTINSLITPQTRMQDFNFTVNSSSSPFHVQPHASANFEAPLPTQPMSNLCYPLHSSLSNSAYLPRAGMSYSPLSQNHMFRPSVLANCIPHQNPKPITQSAFSPNLNRHPLCLQPLQDLKYKSLLPKSTKENIGKDFIQSNDVYLIIIEWNVDWLLEKHKSKGSFVGSLGSSEDDSSVPFKQVRNSYNCYLDFYNTYFPLLLLECWDKVCIALKQARDRETANRCDIVGKIVTYELKSKYISVVTEAVIPSSEREKIPKNGYIILVKFAKVPVGTIKMLGYVHQSATRPYFEHRDQFHETIKLLRPGNASNLTKIKISFYIAFNAEGIDQKQLIQLYRLNNIKKFLKQNDALRYFNKSPLHKVVLQPMQYNVPTIILPTDPQLASCVVEIIINGGSPSTPLTLVKTTKASDPLTILTQLVKGLSRKVLICVKACSMNSVAEKLVDSIDKIVIINREQHAALSPRIKKFVLEEMIENHDISKDDAKCQVLRDCDALLAVTTDCFYEDINVYARIPEINLDCCIILQANIFTEPESLLPLSYGIKNLILFGDPDVPCKVSEKTASYDYNKSLFHRAFSTS